MSSERYSPLHPTAIRPFVAGLAAALLSVSIAAIVTGANNRTDEARGDRVASFLMDQKNAPVNDGDPYSDPLADGQEVTVDEAKSRTPYALPIPQTTAITKERTGIWIDSNDQVAFRWLSGLRFYSEPAAADASHYADSWEKKASSDSTRRLAEVRGTMGIVGDSPEAVSLTFVERGVVMQFVTESHSAEELIDLAQDIEFE